jgi:hypothetical protein
MSRFSPQPRRRANRHGRPKRRVAAVAVGAVAGEAAILLVRTSRIGGNIVVRCRAGHLSTTTWIPGVSVKALRLGPWRFQRCPVGHHWSLVTPVRESDLTEEERQFAHTHRDVRLP